LEHQEVTAVSESTERPAKLLRMVGMIRELLQETRHAPLDEGGRVRLREVRDRTLKELGDALSDDLHHELEQLAIPLEDAPSESDLRVAHAQLVGWLEGLLQGIQAALLIRPGPGPLQDDLPPSDHVTASPQAEGTPGIPRPRERNPGQYL
jgi:hypothetical protein